MVNKIGRNERCPCGSGKKYKHCCGKQKKQLTQAGLLKVLHKLVIEADGIIISCADLDSVPETECLGVLYDAETDTFELKSVLKPEPKLIQVAQSMPRLIKKG